MFASRRNQTCFFHCSPRDAFRKSGAGGFALIVVPSLDLVIYKMGGDNGQYNPTLTETPQPEPNHARAKIPRLGIDTRGAGRV
ncbi:MAG: hypothetical protein HY043_21560 [Verrucomicrobia bacterium]|nr:hypothetical protein [Verrucomicrobiota bacterium]